MTKTVRNILCVMLLLLLPATAMTAQAKGNKTVFIFGLSMSFNDSTVYFTEIQQLDSAMLIKHKNFLYGRDHYSYQLKSYMQGQNVASPTCVIIYSTTRNKIEKKYLKMRRHFQKSKHEGREVKFIDANSFRFIAIRNEQ